MTRKTEQEAFWEGEFGNEYVARNQGRELVAGNLRLFADALRSAGRIESLIEFGSNTGNNLLALRQLLPKARLAAIEINATAVAALEKLRAGGVIDEAFHASIIDFAPDKKYDLALIKGVLIHIAPSELPRVYQHLYQTAGRYICLAEYYSPTPVEVVYRGHQSRLFKRDFAGEMLDAYPDLRLVDYGFCYHRDNNLPLDDINWFLLEKTA